MVSGHCDVTLHAPAAPPAVLHHIPIFNCQLVSGFCLKLTTRRTGHINTIPQVVTVYTPITPFLPEAFRFVVVVGAIRRAWRRSGWSRWSWRSTAVTNHGNAVVQIVGPILAIRVDVDTRIVQLKGKRRSVDANRDPCMFESSLCQSVFISTCDIHIPFGPNLHSTSFGDTCREFASCARGVRVLIFCVNHAVPPDNFHDAIVWFTTNVALISTTIGAICNLLFAERTACRSLVLSTLGSALRRKRSILHLRVEVPFHRYNCTKGPARATVALVFDIGNDPLVNPAPTVWGSDCVGESKCINCL
mmetsp:Transcript_10354/g.19600  ORF Transcript_10354/g.19600 Transcript_10354/m.19600 type:complete len:304 (-) Transcript_10354:294-1205(-)